MASKLVRSVRDLDISRRQRQDAQDCSKQVLHKNAVLLYTCIGLNPKGFHARTDTGIAAALQIDRTANSIIYLVKNFPILSALNCAQNYRSSLISSKPGGYYVQTLLSLFEGLSGSASRLHQDHR